ncbi:MAG: hypothetical protein AAF264_05540 [Pseudomonadota bacterium]
MNAPLATDVEKALRDLVLEAVGSETLRDLRIEPYVDHNGEDALRLNLTLSAEAFEDIDRLSIMSDLFDALHRRQLDLFPYTTFLREGEAA